MIRLIDQSRHTIDGVASQLNSGLLGKGLEEMGANGDKL